MEGISENITQCNLCTHGRFSQTWSHILSYGTELRRWQAARDLLEIFLSNFPPILNSEKESTEYCMDEVIRLYHKNIIHKTV